MNVKRGDVVLAYVDFVESAGGKTRPAVVVQADYYNLRLHETLIAAITSNLGQVHEMSQLLIEVATPDGTATGLLHDSAVSVFIASLRPMSNGSSGNYQPI